MAFYDDSFYAVEEAAGLVVAREADDCSGGRTDSGIAETGGEGGQDLGVGDGLIRGGNGGRVAAGFALDPDLAADPPECGIEEEHGFADHLEEIDEVVTAFYVGEFVG